MLTFVEQEPWQIKSGKQAAIKVIASNGVSSELLKMIVYMSRGLASKAVAGSLYLMLFREGGPQLIKFDADVTVTKKDASKKAHGTVIQGARKENAKPSGKADQPLNPFLTLKDNFMKMPP